MKGFENLSKFIKIHQNHMVKPVKFTKKKSEEKLRSQATSDASMANLMEVVGIGANTHYFQTTYI